MPPDARPSHPGARQRAARLLWQVARPEQRQIGAALLFLILAALLEAAGPLLGKHFIDHYLLPRRLLPLHFAGLLLAFLISGWLATLLRYRQLLRLAGVAMQAVARLREQSYAHVLHLPLSFFDRHMSGQLVSRLTNDSEAVKQLYVQVLFVMLDNAIVVLGALLAMAWLAWPLMLIVSLLLPAVFVIVWLYQRWSAPAVARARELRSDINAQVAESIQGMSTLQACAATERFGTRFRQTNEAHYQARRQELRANAWLLRPALDLLNILLLALILYAFGSARFSGLEIGMLYAFVSYLARVVEPLIQITLQFGQIQQAIVAAARLENLLHTPLPPADGNVAQIQSGAYRLNQIGFSYQPDQPVLRAIDLELAAGSFVGIVGHTGSGKSTLLALLLRFYPPTHGQILLDGQPLECFSEAALRQGIGVVPQDPFLFAASVRENLDMGRQLPVAQIEAAARAAHVHDLILRLEHGYDTLLGEGGGQLSSGEKQLLALARALAGQPRILFLDEATAHIDTATEQRVQDSLLALRGRVTVIAVAHRLATIRQADPILVLNHGQLAESGNHAQLMARPDGLYQRLVQLQSLVSDEEG